MNDTYVMTPHPDTSKVQPEVKGWETFQCGFCSLVYKSYDKVTSIPKEGGGEMPFAFANYAIYRDDQGGDIKVCPHCANMVEYQTMMQHGVGTLYLGGYRYTTHPTFKNRYGQPSRPWGHPEGERGYVSFWNGELKLFATSGLRDHNWGIHCANVWFWDHTGREWYGTNSGDSQLVHARVTKKVDQSLGARARAMITYPLARVRLKHDHSWTGHVVKVEDSGVQWVVWEKYMIEQNIYPFKQQPAEHPGAMPFLVDDLEVFWRLDGKEAE